MFKKCPYCGRELPKPRRRLPSGFGQISEIKGKNLAKPFRAMVTEGKKENGRPVCKLLKPVAYFETYEEAYKALEEYHARRRMTMDALFEMWFLEWLPTAEYPQEILDAWEFCASVYAIPVDNVTEENIKECWRSGFITERNERRYANLVERARIRQLFQTLFDYARERGILKTEK